MNANRMPLEKWIKLSMYMLLGCLVAPPRPAGTARPRFDTSTDMGLVLVPADAEIDSVIFRLRATDQDADFPLIFDITATVTPVVRIENLPCTLYNKVCQANVILTRRLTPGRLHDFAVRVRDSKGDSNSMQATISVTNTTTQRDKIFPHIPAIIMVPEDTKPGKELDYVLVRSNQWSGKPVYIELWQPKELFTVRQRQTPAETRGVITLIGELDFETQSMYTLTMYATDPYTEPKKDTRNIAGLHLVVIVQDVQDVPPIFTLAPPLTKINNTVQPGDVILRVHAEDGDKGVPREVTYGLVSEGNPFTPFFNISETTGEIILARALEELTQITHVGAPVVLSVVAEEIRRSTSEPPAQATVVEVGLLLGEPGNSPPFFENDNYVAWINENAEPGSVITFAEHYSAKVRDEDIGKAGVFALKLENNNGTFEISPAVAERTADFIITVRDNTLIDYETFKSLRFKIIAQEVGPATNLSAIVPATIFIRDVNDNPPEFEAPSYEVTLSENVTAGTRVIQVHATDKDTGSFGRIQYTQILGPGNEALEIDPDTGIITVAMGNLNLDREITSSLRLTVEARDEDGKGLRGIVPLIVNLLDVNDNPPIFERESYEFTLNEDSTNFTMPAIIKAFDADAEPPNNEIRYEIVHGNYENKFYLNEITGEIFLREPINKVRRTRDNPYGNFARKFRNDFVRVEKTFEKMLPSTIVTPEVTESSENSTGDYKLENATSDEKFETLIIRKKRENDDVIFTLTARAYDLGVPHLSGVTQVNVMKGPVAGARIVSFVVPGENPDPVKTAETLAAITGGRVNVQEIRPYTIKDVPNGSETNVPSLEGGKKSIVVARVEPNGGGSSLVDVERIRAALAANGVGVIGGDMSSMETGSETKPGDNGSPRHNTNTNTNTNINVTSVHSEEVTVYKAENRLLFWLLIILGLLMLLALIALIICCICPACPFYMAPRKRRVHSSETLIAKSDGRPKRHLHRKHARLLEASWPGKKQAWSADPTRRNWQFNRRNQKAGGLASLPGDVHIIDQEHEIIDKTASLRLRDGPVTMFSTDQIRRPNEEIIYIEDVEGLRGRGYVDIPTIRQHDMERGMEMSQHQTFINQDERNGPKEQTKFVREQHFYRDGNAEVLRLVTRGQIQEGMIHHHPHRPQTLVIEQEQSGAYRNDGKDILLQRFIEDQTIRHPSNGQDFRDSFQDIEHRSMESHQRQKETVNVQAQQEQQQQKILLIPEKLEDDHRQHIEELGPEVQRLIIDHGNFEKTARFEAKDGQEIVTGATLMVHAPIAKILTDKSKEQSSKQSLNHQHYSIHDLELARQNALLTRLLMERDGREVGGGALIDSASYLETQSLPGQVAIATQTDRTTATQTELPSKSRSDNDESEEDARMRKKLKSKKRYGDGEPRRIRTLWVKSPIEEEEMQRGMEKRTNFLRKKIRDVKENRRISLEPEVLREISDSLDENGEPSVTGRKKDHLEDSNSREESRNEEEGRLEDSSSMELVDDRRNIAEKRQTRIDDDGRRKNHRGKRENIGEPSFRILEREMNSLSKKLSKLTGKKIARYSNGSETDSHERGKTVVMTSAKKFVKKVEIPETEKICKTVQVVKSKRLKSIPKTTILENISNKEERKIREEIVDTKIRQPSIYRKSQTISTGSSDFEEIVEKLKKPSQLVTHVEKQKQVPGKSSQVKLKRQIRVEHKEPPKSSLLPLTQENTESKETSDSASKVSIKSGKTERDSMRTKRYRTETIEGKTEQNNTSQSSDNLMEKKAQRKEKAVMDKKNIVEASETLGKISQEEMAKISSMKTQEKIPVEGTTMEIKRVSPTVGELSLKNVPESVEMQKSEIVEKEINEATTVQKSDDLEKGKFVDSVQHKVLIIPKEEMMNFLTHEMKDSSQALQDDYHSISKGAKIIKDVLLGSVAMESVEEKMASVSEKKIISEAVEFKSSDNFEEWGEGTRDMKKVRHKIVRGKNVEQQSEDGGMFTDNFDSFCGTHMHSKESADPQDPKDEIFYEILQSESSEEQIAEDKTTHMKVEREKDKIVTATDESAEKSDDPQILTMEETRESQKSPSITHFSSPSSDIPTDYSPKKIISRSPTPVSQESVMREKKSEIVPDDSIHKSETKLVASVTVEEPIDTLKDSMELAKSQLTEQLDSKSVGHLPLIEGQIEQLSIDGPTGRVEPEKLPEIQGSDSTAIEDDSKSVAGHLQSVESEIDRLTIDASKGHAEPAKSPEIPHLDLKPIEDSLKSVDHLKSVQGVLQLVEGQIDQLTTDDVKSPVEPAKSPEIEVDLKSVGDNLKSVQDVLQLVEGRIDQLTIDTSKGPVEPEKSPEIQQLHLTAIEDDLKSVAGHLQSVESEIDRLTIDASKGHAEPAKSLEIPHLDLKPIEDSLKSVDHLKSVQGVLQLVEGQIDQLTTDDVKSPVEPAKSPEIEVDLKSVGDNLKSVQDVLQLVEGRIDQLTIDTSKGPTEPEKSPEIQQLHLTAIEDDLKSVAGHLQSVESETDQLTIDTSKGHVEPAKSPEIPHLDLKPVEDILKSVNHLKSVEGDLQSIQGKIDQLTTDDAKSPVESGKSPEISQVDLKSVEDGLKSVQGVLQSVEGRIDQHTIDTSKGSIEPEKSPEIQQLHLTAIEDNLKSVEGDLPLVEGKIGQLTIDDGKSPVESTKSPEIAQVDLKSVEDGLKSINTDLKSVQGLLQSVECRIDEITINAPKDSMEPAKSPEIEKLDLKSVQDHSKSVEAQIGQIPIVPSIDIKISDEKIAINEEPSKPMPEIKSPKLSSPSHEEMLPEKPSQKEFGIADSLFVDAKFLTVPASPEKITSEKNVGAPQKKILEEEKIEIDVPPLNLVELSQAMLDDADDSDDSSEASSKTMLTARPYGTPRHRRISGPEDTKMLEVDKEMSINFETDEHSEMTKVSIKITPVTGEDSESAKSPEKLVKKVLPDEPAEQISPKSPQLQTDVTPSTSRLIFQKTVQDESSPDILSAEISREVPHKEREMPMQDHEENIEKSETEAQEETTTEAATEKVQQLYQMHQEILPADADGFASLPETNEPVKSLEDSTKLPDATPLAEETMTFPVEIMKKDDDDHALKESDSGAKFAPPAGKETKKLPVEIMKKDDDDHALKESDTGAKLAPPAGKETKKLPVEIMKKAADDNVLKGPDTGSKFAPPAGKETKKLPVEIMKKAADDNVLKGPDTGSKFAPPAGKETKKLPVEIMKKAADDNVLKESDTGSKFAPAIGKETKGSLKKRDPSKEDAPRAAKKVLTASTKTPLPKKDQKLKTFKEESSKIAKQTTVVEKFAPSRDSKRQARPAQAKMEEVADTLSRTDRVRRTWRKTDRPDKDAQREERPKMDKMKKIPPSRDDEKSVHIRPSETLAKREKLKDSRAKKNREKGGKMGIKKNIPVQKGKESLQVGEVYQQETVKDVEDLGKMDVGVINQRETAKDVDDRGKKDVEGIVDPSKENVEMPLISRNDQSMAPSPDRSSAKLAEDGKNISEEKTLEEGTELSGDAGVQVPNSIEQRVETKKMENLPKVTEDQDSFLAKQMVESAALIEPAKLLEVPSTSEIIEHNMEMVKFPTDKKDSESILPSPKAKIGEKQHDDEDRRAESIEDKSQVTAVTKEDTSSPRKGGKLLKETEMEAVKFPTDKKDSESVVSPPKAKIGKNQVPAVTKEDTSSPRKGGKLLKETEMEAVKFPTDKKDSESVVSPPKAKIGENQVPAVTKEDTSSPRKAKKLRKETEMEAVKFPTDKKDSESVVSPPKAKIGENQVPAVTKEDMSSPRKGRKLLKETEMEAVKFPTDKKDSESVVSPPKAKIGENQVPAVTKEDTSSPRKGGKLLKETEMEAVKFPTDKKDSESVVSPPKAKIGENQVPAVTKEDTSSPRKDGKLLKETEMEAVKFPTDKKDSESVVSPPKAKIGENQVPAVTKEDTSSPRKGGKLLKETEMEAVKFPTDKKDSESVVSPPKAKIGENQVPVVTKEDTSSPRKDGNLRKETEMETVKFPTDKKDSESVVSPPKAKIGENQVPAVTKEDTSSPRKAEKLRKETEMEAVKFPTDKKDSESVVSPPEAKIGENQVPAITKEDMSSPRKGRKLLKETEMEAVKFPTDKKDSESVVSPPKAKIGENQVPAVTKEDTSSPRKGGKLLKETEMEAVKFPTDKKDSESVVSPPKAKIGENQVPAVTKEDTSSPRKGGKLLKETEMEAVKFPTDKKDSESVVSPPKAKIEENQVPAVTKEDTSSPRKGRKLLKETEMEAVKFPTDKKDSESVVSPPKAKIEGKQHDEEDRRAEYIEDKSRVTAVTKENTSSPRKAGKLRKETEMVAIESQSRYMEWYRLKREEMERKRQERKAGDEEEDRPKWLRKSTRQRWFKGGPDERKIFDPKMAEMTPSKRRKIKPLVNVESEQLKAIVRQGRKLRKAQGEKGDEPQIQIFAPEKPPTPLSSIPINSRYHHQHHLVQHSEYKYEKMPLTPFYLHPPPVPHTSPQISPHNFENLHPEQYSSLPTDSRCPSERYEPGIVHQQQQGGNKLRHGQLLEKKSVFDIAYSEAAPSQLRSDSTTPPS